MPGIIMRSEEEQLAKGATFLDDMDMVISPHGGHLVPVAMKNGVHVCWGCGEPFNPANDKLRMVEKFTGGTVPVGVHAKCVSPSKRRPSFHAVTQGLHVRRELARVARASIGLVEAAAEGAKKIVAGLDGGEEATSEKPTSDEG